jgi:hypothetical protein
MATSVARDEKHQDWAEPGDLPSGPPTNQAEWLWTLISLALLVLLVAFVVDDHLLRALLADH